MKRISLLSIQLWLRRLGWTRSIALLLCIAASAGLLVLRHVVDTRLADSHQARLRAEEQLMRPAAPAAVDRSAARLAHFYDMLGDARHAEQQIKTLFALAARHGLVLSKAEYTLTPQPDGRYTRYQVSLPVRGNYNAVRRFGEQWLLAVPFATLDQMQFRRDSIANDMVEANLRLTIFLSNQPRTSAPERVR